MRRFSDDGFQSTRPVWGATIAFHGRLLGVGFQSTRPVWGATPRARRRCNSNRISIHAPRVGRDTVGDAGCVYSRDFNPRAPCGARRDHQYAVYKNDLISIHAPRVGRDRCQFIAPTVSSNFNPRAPCGARQRRAFAFTFGSPFQSTRPVWGATASCVSPVMSWIFQSTRPVWGATSRYGWMRRTVIFQSTRPVWGATGGRAGGAGYPAISIHAPRVGRDHDKSGCIYVHRNFNPRAPCGARLAVLQRHRQSLRISIHAPRVGRDGVGA